MIIDKMQLCPGCGRVFEPYRPYQKFCSKECRIKKQGKPYYYKKKLIVEKECRECGKIFKTNHGAYVFCSEECRLKYYAGWYNKKEEEKRVCTFCGEAFSSSHHAKKYCSHQCYYNAMMERRLND